MERDARAAPLWRRELGQRRAGSVDVGAERMHPGEDPEHVHGDMAARHADAAGEAPSEDIDARLRAALVLVERAKANVGLLRGAEADDAPGRARKRVGREPCRLRVVDIDDRGAAGLDAAEEISALASAIAATDGKNSRCTGSTVVTIAACGRTMVVSGLISPGEFMPISAMANCASRGMRAKVSGTPQ